MSTTLTAFCSCCQPSSRRRGSRFNEKFRLPSDTPSLPAYDVTPPDRRRFLSCLRSSIPTTITTTLPTTVRPRFRRLRSKNSSIRPIEDQPIHEQPQSKLMGRLPAEVRQMIFKYALGREGWNHRALHLDTVYNTCAATYCHERKPPNLRPCKHNCSRCHAKGSQDVRKMMLQGSMHLSALLRTCRKAYSEAVEILYGHNTFLFHNAPDITLFLRSLPPRLQTCLRSIQLFAYIPTPIDEISPRICSFYVPDIYTWRVMCSALARLPNLKELIICLGLIHARSSRDPWTPKQANNAAASRVLDCLRMIDGPEVFRVKIKRPWGEEVELLKGWAPFEFEVL